MSSATHYTDGVLTLQNKQNQNSYPIIQSEWRKTFVNTTLDLVHTEHCLEYFYLWTTYQWVIAHLRANTHHCLQLVK